jgi:hypothetical protein
MGQQDVPHDLAAPPLDQPAEAGLLFKHSIE